MHNCITLEIRLVTGFGAIARASQVANAGIIATKSQMCPIVVGIARDITTVNQTEYVGWCYNSLDGSLSHNATAV